MIFLKTILDSFLVLVVLGLVFLDLTKNIGLTEFANSVQVILGTDKRLHFVTGAIITLFLFRLLYRVTDFKYINTLSLSVMATTILLVGDECSQLLFPNRKFDAYDILAGMLGVLSMFLLLMLYQLVINKQSQFSSLKTEDLTGD